MNTVTVYACPSVPMDSIECTIEYDPAVVEAFLHPPNSGQERADDGSFGDEKVLRRGCPTLSGLDDPEIVLVSKGKISHFVTLCITSFKEFSR